MVEPLSLDPQVANRGEWNLDRTSLGCNLEEGDRFGSIS